MTDSAMNVAKIAVLLVYFLTVPMIISLVRQRLNINMSMGVTLFMNFLAIWLSIIIFAVLQGAYLNLMLQSFDLDGDGVFGGVELTEDQAIYMDGVVNDTGRTFAPITGFFVAIIHTISVFAILSVHNRRSR